MRQEKQLLQERCQLLQQDCIDQNRTAETLSYRMSVSMTDCHVFTTPPARNTVLYFVRSTLEILMLLYWKPMENSFKSKEGWCSTVWGKGQCTATCVGNVAVRCNGPAAMMACVAAMMVLCCRSCWWRSRGWKRSEYIRKQPLTNWSALSSTSGDSLPSLHTDRHGLEACKYFHCHVTNVTRAFVQSFRHADDLTR